MGGHQSQEQAQRRSLSALEHMEDVLPRDILRNQLEKYLTVENKYLCRYIDVWTKCSSPDSQNIMDLLPDLDGFPYEELDSMEDNVRRKKIMKICADKLNTQLSSFKEYIFKNKINVH